MSLPPINRSPFHSDYNKEIFKTKVEEDNLVILVELDNIDDLEKKFEKAKDKAFKEFNFSQCVGQYNFDASDPEQKQMLFELAKLQVGFYNNELAKYIKNYGFDPKNPIDQKMLATLAKLVSQGKETSRYIQNFGLSDKALLAEIAMSNTKHKFNSVSSNIKNYGFDPSVPEEKQILFEIAELEAASNPCNLSLYIKNFGFDPLNHEDQKMLAKLAKLVSPGKETSKYIQNFGLSDKALLAEIAKLEAASNPCNLSLYIENFGFDSSKPEEKQMLQEIFDIAFEISPIVANNISCFGIQDKEKRFEIGMNFARKIDPEQLGSFNLFEFIDVKDPEGPYQLISLFNELFTKNPYDAIDNFQDFMDVAIEDLQDPIDNQKLLQTFQEVLSLLAYGDVSSQLLASSFSTSAKLISSFEKAVAIRDTYLNYTTLTYLGFFACHALVSKAQHQLLLNLDNLYVLEALEKVRDQSLRMALIPVLTKVLEQSEVPTKGNIASELPLLLVHALHSQHSNADLVKREESAILNLKTTLKDGNTSKALLKTLLALIEAKMLSPETVCNLIEFSLNDPTHSKICTSQLNKLTAILNLGAEDLLDTPNLDFTSILEEAFKRKVPALVNQEGFAEKLMDTFQSSRKPVAIFEYVATLEKLIDPNKRSACQKALGEFILSVLNGTFEKERISLIGNPHLKALYENHPAIFNKWVEQYTSKVVNINGSSIRISRTDNPYDILNCGTEIAGSCQNINGNPNLNRGVLGYLLNGHQMITLKLENPKIEMEPIIGRAIFRLAMLQDKSPVLFLEKIYPKTLDDSYKNELKTYARDYATTLGCPLVSKDEGDASRSFDGSILSLGGRAAEYVDAIGGISEDCIYSIEEANYV